MRFSGIGIGHCEKAFAPPERLANTDIADDYDPEEGNEAEFSAGEDEQDFGTEEESASDISDREYDNL